MLYCQKKFLNSFTKFSQNPIQKFPKLPTAIALRHFHCFTRRPTARGAVKSQEENKTFTSSLWFWNESQLLQFANLLFVDLRKCWRKKVGRRTKLSLHVCCFELKANLSNCPNCSVLFMDLRRDGRKKLGRGTKLSLHVCGFELKVNFSKSPTCSSWILEEVGDSATWFHSVSNVKTRSPTVTFTSYFLISVPWRFD